MFSPHLRPGLVVLALAILCVYPIWAEKLSGDRIIYWESDADDLRLTA